MGKYHEKHNLLHQFKMHWVDAALAKAIFRNSTIQLVKISKISMQYPRCQAKPRCPQYITKHMSVAADKIIPNQDMNIVVSSFQDNKITLHQAHLHSQLLFQ